MVKRILAGVCDARHTLAVAHYTRELALRCGAEVTAIAVSDFGRLRNVGRIPIGTGSLEQELVQERMESNEASIEESLDLLVRCLEEASVPCRVIKAGGGPYDALVDASRYQDLMVFGLRGLFEHGVTNEPPHELVQLVESGVRPILATGPSHREITRVLIAYSGSVESAKTMRDYANLDLWPDVRIKVVHFGKHAGDGPVLLTEARGYLQDHGFDVEIELIESSAKNEVLQQAEQWDADLIVVGNSAKSLVRRRVFGETALTTIRDSQLPLFLSQ